MSDTYQRLVALLAGSFGLDADDIAPDSTLGALELDSLALVELSVASQEEFGVELDDSEIDLDSTVAQAAGVISGKLTAHR
ncbi:acyl carrier protein [Streptomyces spiramenti]|uniref:Acyl carrier protein n=1 Tax=Streptomyces spiramenti TaxID=2720606 RepID=A0ABX1ALU1_9ACTN|nr:acyl carrier protein [Streptomyces spiramenti]NJP66799.1 acyl carrier protein [Streptomyces spiramenti]